MGPEAWLTLVVLIGLVVALVREIVPPAAAIVGALVVLVLLDVSEPADALVGFSSTATATVALLFIVAAAIQRHAGIEHLLHRSLGSGRDSIGDRAVLARLCAPVAAASSVVANTPLVAALAPVVRNWADRSGRPASRVLMPLSFATILGGTVTTIGTSTTLVASGLVEEAMGQPFGLFEVTPIGLPVALVGTVVLVLLAPRLLPDRGDVLLDPERSYAFRMAVVHDGPLEGLSLLEAGLRNLPELFVASIDRGPGSTTPARPDSRLAGGDELLIVGSAEHINQLPRAGLRHPDDTQVHALDEDRDGLYEVVVGRSSPLAGRTLKQVSFRGRYGAAVLAIDRSRQRLEGKLGTIPIQSGDTMLLRAGDEFVEQWRDTLDFAVIARLDQDAARATGRAPLVIAIALAMVGVAGLGILPLVEAVLWAVVALIATRTIGFRDALSSIDGDVLLIIAAAIGIGANVEASGLAGWIATQIGAVATGTAPWVGLLLLLVATTLLTEVVTNVAGAALMVPVAISSAEAVGTDPRGWAIAVAVAASAAFLTPIGYQTNTIVYGLGGYRFGDYWRLGLPLVIVVLVVQLIVVPLVWG